MPSATAVPGIKFELATPPRAPVEIRTDIAAFVGFAQRGPFHRATRIESWQQFESTFGGCSAPGFLPLAVHAFFANGGVTCYVVRVLEPPGIASSGAAAHASYELPLLQPNGTSSGRSLRLIATSPGVWGNRLSIEIVPRIIELGGAAAFRFMVVVRDGTGSMWRLVDCSLDPADARFLPYVMTVLPDLPIRLGARHTGAPDEEALLRSASDRELLALPVQALTGSDQPFGPAYRLKAGQWQLSGGRDGVKACTLEHLTGNPDAPNDVSGWGLQALTEIDEVCIVAIPDAAPFPRRTDPAVAVPREPDCMELYPKPVVSAPRPPEHIEYPPRWSDGQMRDAAFAAIRFCELRRDCVALLDMPADVRTPRAAEEYRSQFDSSFAGIYWPWLLVDRNPRGTREQRDDPRVSLIEMPPSGMVAGLTASADLQVGPHRTPAGQTARGAIAVSVVVNDDDHGILNLRGVNVFRERIGRGVVLEGTRSLVQTQRSGNPLRHLNVRRVMMAIVEAIDERTQWSVFEPNNQQLWADLRDVVRSFLTRRWRLGWLSGRSEADAFYVTCDETTNPPESIELGYIVAYVGLRFPPPIEWIVVHIGRSSVGAEILDVERA